MGPTILPITSSVDLTEALVVAFALLGISIQWILLRSSLRAMGALRRKQINGKRMIVARADIRGDRLRIAKLMICLTIGLVGVLVPEAIHPENVLFERGMMMGLVVLAALIVIEGLCDYRDKVRVLGELHKPGVLEKVLEGVLPIAEHPLRRCTDQLDASDPD